MQTFAVHFSTGQPVQPGQPRTNSFGLRGQGQVRFDEQFLTFEGAHDSSSQPRLARADVANVDYVPEKGAFLIRSRQSSDFVLFWTPSREDAEAIWALLPQEKTPEYLAEQQQNESFWNNMQKLGRRAHVTPAVIAFNAVIFVLMALSGVHLVEPDSASLIDWGSNFGPFTWSGQPWRLFSGAFLHAGILHLSLNLFALYQGGALAERLYGSARFTLIYLLSALSGSVVSAWHDPLRNSVGASGAIFGVYGALLVFFAMRRQDFPPRWWRVIGLSMLLFCGYSLTMGAAHPAIDNAAHVGGLLGGALAGAVLVRPFDAETRRPQPTRLAVAALVVLVPIAALAWPLMKGPVSDSLHFHAAYSRFLRADQVFTRRLATALTPEEFARTDRLELARRLRADALTPWRAASRPLLEGATLPTDGSLTSRRQQALREYIRAKDRAMEYTARALESGDADSARAAERAQTEVDRAVQRLNDIGS